MRKVTFCLSLLIISASTFAQKTAPAPPDLPHNPDDDKVYYSQVVEMSGVSKEELFKRAKIWYLHFYKNPGSVIKSVDSTNGKIELLPQFPVYRTLKNDVKAQSAIVIYNLQIDLKDGKYRYQIHDVHLKDASYVPIEKLFNGTDANVEDHYNTLSEAKKYFDDLIMNFTESMKEPSNKEKKDEW